MVANDISIDLETLDTVPTSKIVSIGLCRFDIQTGIIYDTLYLPVSLKDQQNRTLSPGTLCWWMQQSDEARKVFWDDDIRCLKLQMCRLSDFVRKNPQSQVWGNGSTFDISILEDAYLRTVEQDIPWKFWAVRDMRTIIDLAESITSNLQSPTFKFKKSEVSRDGVHHNAMDDAVFQAKCISMAYQSLRRYNVTHTS